MTDRRLGGLDLNLVPALEALLDERNVTKAAARCDMPQPRMSNILRRLREHFGNDLLVPSGRHLVLTAFAQNLLEPARAAVAELEQLVGVAAADFDPSATDRPVRTFRVLASDYIDKVLLQPFLRELIAINATVRLDVHPVQQGYAEHARTGQADLLILPSALVDLESLRREILLRDRFVLALHRNNPRIGDHITREQWRSLPHISYTAGAVLPSLGEQILEDHDLADRRIVWTVQHFSEVREMLHGCPEAVAVAHQRHVECYPDDLRWIPIPTTGGDPQITELALRRPGHSDPGHAWLLERIRYHAHQLPPLTPLPPTAL